MTVVKTQLDRPSGSRPIQPTAEVPRSTLDLALDYLGEDGGGNGYTAGGHTITVSSSSQTSGNPAVDFLAVNIHYTPPLGRNQFQIIG